MRTCTRETLSRVMLLAAAWLLLLVVLPAARLDAQPVPPDAADDQDDPPRHDLRMGNTENMRLGRDAQGNIIMEIHAPPPNMQAQPPVGPFFIYPQVGVPMGVQGGQGPSGGTTWGRTGTSGRTSTWGSSGQTMQPGQTVRPSGQ